MTTSMTDRGVSRTPWSRMAYWLAGLGMLGGLVQILGGILETIDRVQPGQAGYEVRTSLMGLAYLLFLAPVAALSRSGLAEGRRTPRLGLIAAGAGWILYAVAQFLLQVDVNLAERVLFPIGTVIIGVGMITVGVGVLRSLRWTGWRRAVPLICGLYPFVVIFPSFASTGEPNFLVLSGWGVCWFALGAALWHAATTHWHHETFGR